MGMDVLKSQTGTGYSKRVMAAVSAILGLGVVVMSIMGQPEVGQEITNQTPMITDGVSKTLEAFFILMSAVMAIWSKWQDKR